MLEHCQSLADCEKILSEAIETVNTLGEIDFSESDLDRLGELIREALSAGTARGARSMMRYYPVSLASFLVWTGVYGYKEGDYWTAVEEKVGLKDINWQQKWGKFFLNFLIEHHMETFNIETTHKYVTPILLHGGIPNSCLDEYFKEIVYPYVIKSPDTLTDGEVIQELQLHREDELQRKEILAREKSLTENILKKKQEIARLQLLFENWEKISNSVSIEQVDPVQEQNGLIDPLPDWQAKLDQMDSQLDELSDTKQKLTNRTNEYSASDRAILAIENDIQVFFAAKKDFESLTRQIQLVELQIEEHGANLSNSWRLLSDAPLTDTIITSLANLSPQNLKQLGKEEARFSEPQRSKSIDQPTQKNKSLSRKLFETVAFYFFSWLKQRQAISNNKRSDISLTASQKNYGQPATAKSPSNPIKQLPIRSNWFESKESQEELSGRLSVMKEISQGYLASQGELLPLKQKQSALKHTVQELSLEIDSKFDGITLRNEGEVNALLALAHEHKQAYETATAILDEEINPRLKSLNLERERIESLKTRLEAEDIPTVAPIEIADSDILSEELYKLYTYYNAEGRGKQTLSQDLERLSSEQAEMKDRRNSSNDRILAYPDAFPYVDKPIKRFLLYGGRTAQQVFGESAKLLQRTIDDESVPPASEFQLQSRIYDAFVSWWKKEGEIVNQGEDYQDASGQRFGRPIIYFDLNTREVMVKLPSQRALRNMVESSIEFHISGGSKKKSVSLPLHCHFLNDILVECHEFHTPIPFSATRYHFSLRSGDAILYSWDIEATPSGSPYLAFQQSSGRLLEAGKLTKSRIILLLKNAYTIHPESCIRVAGDQLHGGWSSYSLWQLDLGKIDNLSLTHTDGRTLSLPITPELHRNPFPINATPEQQIKMDGFPVYFETAPEFIIPVAETEEIYRWRLTIKHLGGEAPAIPKKMRLGELKDSLLVWNTEHNGFLVPLNASEFFGDEPFGLFRIQFKKGHSQGYTFTFAVIPKLQVRFKDEIYLPREPSKTLRMAADISIDPQYRPVEPLPPATIKNGLIYMRDQDVLRILLTNVDNPLEVEIPRLLWRIRSPKSKTDDYRQWRHVIEEEIWYGDISSSEMFLDLKFPSWFRGEVTLRLQQKPQRHETRTINRGQVSFDLRAFDDALRKGPSVRSFTVSFTTPEAKTYEATLFSIRTRWIAEDIECIQTSSRDKIHLKINWNEKGMAGKKAVRLWKHNTFDEENPIASTTVSDGITTTTISGTLKNMPPGSYLVQIEEIDPWSVSKPTRPLGHAENTKLIDIVKPKNLLQDEVLRIIQVIDNNEHHRLANVYHLRIIGRILNRNTSRLTEKKILLTDYNFGWYLGEFVHPHDDIDQQEFEQSNPVKFEYIRIRDRIHSIEDSNGDGTMYCKQCRKLFWNDERLKQEAERGHDLIGPIEEFIIA